MNAEQKAALIELTQQRLKELLDYDPETGLFTRKTKVGGREIGSIAGSPNNEGYIVCRVDGARYKAHRLAFLFMTGKWPLSVDHINRSTGDNRWCNLRACDVARNNMNRNLQSNNSSGYRGVRWHKLTRKWVAAVGVSGKNKHLGYFDSKEAAAIVAENARKKLHGEFASLVREAGIQIEGEE